MLATALRVLLTFNATSLLLVVYQIKDPLLFSEIEGLQRYALNLGLVSVPVALTAFSIWLSQWLGKDSFDGDQIETIEYANNSFLPSYLGYFFVALSIPNLETLAFVYAILFVFTFVSQALYFNPLFLLYGFKFYNVKTKRGTSIFLISKEEYRIPSEIVIPVARRINGYTFLKGK